MVGISTLVLYFLAVSMSPIGVESTNEAKPEKRIFGGKFATPHEFPHHLFLFKQLTNKTGEICGGSLLAPEWVLTAAHCVSKPKLGLRSFLIIAGKHKNPLTDKLADPDQQLSRAKEVFVHPCYIEDMEIDPQVYNDIALIKLASPFTLNEKIQTIEIDETDRAKPGTLVTAIGWGGKTPELESTDPYPHELKKATLKLPTEMDCLEEVPGIDVDSQICANDMAGYICFGDSGGPLLCKHVNINYVCGITSFVSDIKCENGPSAFVRVFHFRNWIKEVMANGNNSRTGCVTQKFTIPPKTIGPTTTERPGRINISENEHPSAASTLQVKLVHGSYIGMILISILFTYEINCC